MKDISVFSALRAFALSDRNRILCTIVLLLGLVPIIPGFVSTWTLANHRTLTYCPFERWNMHSAFEVLTIQTSDASLRTHYLPRSLYRTLLIELHALEASLTYIKVVGTMHGSSSEYHGLNTTSSYNHRSIMSDLRGSHPHPSYVVLGFEVPKTFGKLSEEQNLEQRDAERDRESKTRCGSDTC